MKSIRNTIARLYQAWRKAQTPVILPLALTTVGIVALILGEGASKAFADLGGSTVIRVMGVFMIIGGVLIVSSILNANYPREVLGLSLAALGAAIYGGGVVLGLHSQGLVSGIGYAGITLTLLGRIYFLLEEARRRERLKQQMP
jgi:hypothetical protein